MSTEPPNMPPELRDRLREEPHTERTDLEAVWDLLGTVDAEADERADAEDAWHAITRHHPELADTSVNGAVGSQSEPTDSRAEPRRRTRPSRSPSHGRRQRWALGLALAMLLLVGGIWLWRQPTTVTAPAGQHRTATLPDGSTVELNSGSTISYRRGFQAWPLVDADRRVVYLEGEAFFDITQQSPPFAVETATAEVAVLGTRFNVRARRAESATRVTVLAGRVRVAPQTHPEQSVVLTDPGQTSRITELGVTLTGAGSTNVDHVLAWRNDGFAVHARPLSKVLDELERRYAKRVRLHPSVSRSNAPVSLYYPGPTALETILHDLCTARGLKYRSTSQGFTVYGPQSGP